eukprot:493146-Rhodomonas_salina.2
MRIASAEKQDVLRTAHPEFRASARVLAGEKDLPQHAECTIRVRLSDGALLQARFAAREPVAALYRSAPQAKRSQMPPLRGLALRPVVPSFLGLCRVLLE